MKQVKSKLGAFINKKNYSVIGIVVAVVVFLISSILIVISVGNSLVKTDAGRIPNQTVEGLSFENATIQVENGISKYTVDVTNDLSETIELKTIEIVIKNETGEKIASLIGYIGDSIESGESKVLMASVDEKIENVLQVEYIIRK